VLLAAGGFLVYRISSSTSLGTSPVWRGIQPGRTTLEEALDILGPADKVGVRGEYDYYRYVEREDPGWERVELWVQEQRGENMVVGILRDRRYEEGISRVEDFRTLEELVLQYGRPDDVKWTVQSHMRYLIWARQGISTSVLATQDRIDEWDKLWVFDIVLFEPMSLRKYLGTAFPLWDDIFEGWIPENMYAPGLSDAPDRLPEDPYDWAHMPTPYP
jgi:hypothetical protein